MVQKTPHKTKNKEFPKDFQEKRNCELIKLKLCNPYILLNEQIKISRKQQWGKTSFRFQVPKLFFFSQRALLQETSCPAVCSQLTLIYVAKRWIVLPWDRCLGGKWSKNNLQLACSGKILENILGNFRKYFLCSVYFQSLSEPHGLKCVFKCFKFHKAKSCRRQPFPHFKYLIVHIHILRMMMLSHEEESCRGML